MLLRAALFALAAASLAPLPARAVFLCNTPNCVLPDTLSGTGMGLRSQSATRFSIGLQIDLFTGEPQLVAAVRHTTTLPHNQVYGGQGDITMPLNAAQPLQWPTVRALGIAGERDVMALLGGGLALGPMAPVATVAMQVPYATAGVNYVYGRGWQPYAGVNSFARAVAPRVVGGTGGTSYRCPTGYTLKDAASAGVFVSATQTNGAGKTCVGALPA